MMKKIDVYEVVIKIIGFYLIIPIFQQFNGIIGVLTVWIQQKEQPAMFGHMNLTPSLVATISGLLVLMAISSLLIFKTTSIARLTSHKKDMEADLSLLIDQQSVYEICLILLGLIMVVSALPDFILACTEYVTHVPMDVSTANPNSSMVISSGLKMGIGVAALAYGKRIANLLAKKADKSE